MPPLVSCIMPTKNRREFIPSAIRSFLRQVYEPKELIIIDDGEPIYDLIPKDDRILYVHVPPSTTGWKRNKGCYLAVGSVIANWDDDDWSGAHRLEDQIQRLLKTGKAVTGYNETVRYDVLTGNFHFTGGGPPYFASGTSQCYLKSWWDDHCYPNCSVGEDSVFSREARLADQLAIAPVGRMMVVRTHENNTDKVDLKRLEKIDRLKVDFEFIQEIEGKLPYSHVCSDLCKELAQQQFNSPVVEYKVSSLPEVRTR